MAIKTLRVFAEYTSTGFVPMPTAGGIDYGYTLASTFPSTTPSSFQTDDPDLDVTVTAMTDFYVWIRINGTAWNPSYTRNVRVYPDSPDINSVVMNMIIATGPAGTSAYSQIVQTSNRLYFNGATADSTYNSKFAGKTYINELNFGTAPQLATVATSGAYADLTGKPALSTVATSGSYADLSNKPSGTAPISYNSGTNSFQISVASASTNGYLTSTDWSTFNAKYLLPSGGTTAQYLRGDGTLATFPTTLDSTRLIFTGKNATGATLTKGTVVYINGVSGNTALLAKALATQDSTSAQTLGVVEFDIANNQSGVVVLVGAVAGLDTSSFTEGVQLYLSGTTAGAFTSSKILAPTHLVYVGIVTRAHPTQGTIEVKVQNGYELDEIHDVQISSPANKDILYRDSATSLWKHASIASVLGYTPYNATNPNNYIALTALSASAPLSYNNTTGAFTISQANTSTNGFLSSTDWNTFNSKQNALTLGNVSEVSSNVLMFPDGGTGKTIGNLSIQVIQASASTNGYLSYTDWSTFNNKQATITGGATTILSSNLTASRALTSNASGKVDVSTVTSTELGYLSGVTSAIQTQLNAKQGTVSLTTTGTNGAATFSANTLNIPNYGSSLSGTINYVAKFTSASAVGNSQIFDNGTNVGIGTATPSSLLTVRLPTTSFGVAMKWGNESFGDYGGLGFNSSGMFLGYAGNNHILVNSSGNVGIGTSSPNNYGSTTVTIASSSATNTGALVLRNSTSTVRGHYYSDGANSLMALGSATAHPLAFITNDTEKMRITSAGNVGIANSSPTSLWAGTFMQISSDLILGKLNVNGYSYLSHNVAYDNSSFKSINGGSGILVGFSGAEFNIDTASGASSAGSTYPTFTRRLTVTNSGNIGIGTAEPLYRLTIRGTQSKNSTTYQAPLAIFTNDSFDVNPFGVNFGIIGNTSQSARRVSIQTTEFGLSNDGLLSLQESGGNVLIGTGTNGGYKLYVSGAIYATSNIIANSDSTLKKNLKLVDNPIDKLNQLNGYLYQWKEDDSYQYGVIAQEVEKILPHAVTTGTNGIKGVAYNQLIPVMIEAIKELNAEVKLLKAK